MSRGQRARTPENFPRMKHRASGRIIKHEQAVMAPSTLRAFGLAANAAAEAIGSVFNAYVNAFLSALQPRLTRDDFVLTPDKGEE